ncbi:MAG: DUF2590 family protein [Victivallaceae bacterium]
MIYSDIKLEADDLVISGAQAAIIEDRDVIIQDVVTALRVSGLLVLLVGDRDAESRAITEGRIIDLVEEDSRIVPGTVAFESETGGYLLTGQTYEFGGFAEEISI